MTRTCPSRKWLLLIGIVCALQAGCGMGRPHVDQSLLEHRPSPTTPTRLAEHYAVRFPDVIEVRVTDRPSLSGERVINVEGKIELSPGDFLRVEGKSASQIADLIADHMRYPVAHIKVKVTGFHSQRLFLHGEVKGAARAVSYVGPESVLDLLQRVGGITSGAAPEDIQVVRAHVAEGKPPEVFNVDLDAILNRNDQETNIRLRPFDQIYVGQSRTSALTRCLPPWLRPLYDRICGLSRPGDVREQPIRERRRSAIAHRAERRYTAPRSE
jgi:protein involved in polysaccharide export with SLBB domain